MSYRIIEDGDAFLSPEGRARLREIVARKREREAESSAHKNAHDRIMFEALMRIVHDDAVAGVDRSSGGGGPKGRSRAVEELPPRAAHGGQEDLMRRSRKPACGDYVFSGPPQLDEEEVLQSLLRVIERMSPTRRAEYLDELEKRARESEKSKGGGIDGQET